MPDPQDATQLAELLSLTGATTVAAAMATDGWKTARAGIASLFRRAGQAKQASIENQLDANAALVAAAENAERARRAITPLWQLELEQLLSEFPNPETAAELQSVVDQIQAALPATGRHWVQTQINNASGSATLFAALGGNIIVHGARATHQPAGEDMP